MVRSNHGKVLEEYARRDVIKINWLDMHRSCITKTPRGSNM